MTLSQLELLTDDELEMVLYVCNVISPHKLIGELPPRGLTWYRKGVLENTLLQAFNQVKPEGHSIYSSLLTKLGVQHEIRQEQPPGPCEIKHPDISGSVSGSL